jgi:hypothetical protein
MVDRSAAMGRLFKAAGKSSIPLLSAAMSAGPDIKKHGCTRPVAPITAENSGALHRTGGYAPSP